MPQQRSNLFPAPSGSTVLKAKVAIHNKDKEDGMMKSIRISNIPDLSELSGDECTDTDLIATYLSETRGWSIEECIDQVMFYRIQASTEFYDSLTEEDCSEIDPCIQAWIYAPMETYLITSL